MERFFAGREARPCSSVQSGLEGFEAATLEVVGSLFLEVIINNPLYALYKLSYY